MEHCGCWRCMDKPCPRCEELVNAIRKSQKAMLDGRRMDAAAALEDALEAHE